MKNVVDTITENIKKAQENLESARAKSNTVIPLTDDLVTFLVKVSNMLDSTPQEEKLQVCLGAFDQLRNWSMEVRGDSIRQIIKNEERIEALNEVKSIIGDLDDVTPSRPSYKEY